MLSLSDIKVGMKVNPRDLDEIYDTLIILANFEGKIGEILYIGQANTSESHYVYTHYDGICTVFNVDEEYDE
jgi:hypothetical protein